MGTILYVFCLVAAAVFAALSANTALVVVRDPYSYDAQASIFVALCGCACALFIIASQVIP